MAAATARQLAAAGQQQQDGSNRMAAVAALAAVLRGPTGAHAIGGMRWADESWPTHQSALQCMAALVVHQAVPGWLPVLTPVQCPVVLDPSVLQLLWHCALLLWGFESVMCSTQCVSSTPCGVGTGRRLVREDGC